MDQEIINNRYHLISKIKESKRVGIFVGQDLNTSKKRLIKVLKGSLGFSNQEVSIQSKLNHRAFPEIIDISTYKGDIYMIQKYVDGRTLKEVLESDVLHLNEVLVWIIQLADALKYLESHDFKIVHGDIKPDNLIIDNFGNLNIIDFGISKVNVGGPALEGGTYEYSPPEQMLMTINEEISDIYSFGKVSFELIGKLKIKKYLGLPYRDQRIAELERVCSNCLATNPKNRFNNFNEILDEIMTILNVSTE